MTKSPASRTRTIVLGFLLLASPILLFCGITAFLKWRMAPRGWKGAAYETKTFKGPSCSVRVTAYKEETRGFALPGGYLGFEASVEGSGTWSPILETRHDDPLSIPDRCVLFDGPNGVTAVMGLHCVVSSDGGKTWRVWDPRSQEKK